MTRAPPTQVHDSINSPPLIAITHQFSTPQTISPSRGRQPILILAPTQHTILVVEALLDTANSSLSDTSVHLYRPIIPLKIKHLIMLRQCMDITNHRHISHRVIYHRLFISAQSPLIPHKWTLYLTMNNTIHPLTVREHNISIISHHLYLFLNPHNCLPHLRHTHTIDQNTIHNLITTTSLPSTRTGFDRPSRWSILWTTSHVPDLVTTLTFPAATVQYQLSIMTLATQMLLSISILNPTQISWTTI